MNKIKSFFLAHKTTVIMVLVLGLLGVLGWLGVANYIAKPAGPVEEVDLAFDPEGPYALLLPRRDGNALILNLKRTGSYESISYELAYTSIPEEVEVKGTKISEDGESFGEGSIDRGVIGEIDTKEKKGEYEQEILFGSCSKAVCKYDKGVENGTLSLKIKRGNKLYKMITQWHLQKPDVALGNITSGDGHLIYKTEAGREELANIAFTIVNDLTGVPKLPSGKQVVGKVYALNAPVAKEISAGSVTLELAETPPENAKLFKFNQSKSEWEELKTVIEGTKLLAKAEGSGIFAVLTSN